MTAGQQRQVGVDCPSCSSRLPWSTVRATPFNCPLCQARICMPKSYNKRLGLISLVATILGAYVVGAGGLTLLISIMVALFPAMVLTFMVARRLVPPTLMFCEGDDNT
jgi:hypothetical protein